MASFQPPNKCSSKLTLVETIVNFFAEYIDIINCMLIVHHQKSTYLQLCTVIFTVIIDVWYKMWLIIKVNVVLVQQEVNTVAAFEITYLVNNFKEPSFLKNIKQVFLYVHQWLCLRM